MDIYYNIPVGYVDAAHPAYTQYYNTTRAQKQDGPVGHPLWQQPGGLRKFDVMAKEMLQDAKVGTQHRCSENWSF